MSAASLEGGVYGLKPRKPDHHVKPTAARSTWP